MRLAFLLTIAACSTWTSSGSVYRGRCVHVGVRPASDGLGDYAVTAQVSTEWAPCRTVYPDDAGLDAFERRTLDAMAASAARSVRLCGTPCEGMTADAAGSKVGP